jgi:hypothetical protein
LIPSHLFGKNPRAVALNQKGPAIGGPFFLVCEILTLVTPDRTKRDCDPNPRVRRSDMPAARTFSLTIPSGRIVRCFGRITGRLDSFSRCARHAAYLTKHKLVRSTPISWISTRSIEKASLAPSRCLAEMIKHNQVW